ncbi:MAG TPA: phosphotransferase family protein [Candidatus Saccharimonadales bacterium]|jgi:aminoglycoside phosphotransferase (APT) family kinase protein|nr:phosphotransferase family protein [Candidatus Saccharimonadales bacterium]
MIEAAEVKARLRDAVARFLGPPGDILELRRLTAGATKATWSFTAQIGDTQRALVLQISTAASRADGLVAGSDAAQTEQIQLPMLGGKDDAAVMLAAAKAGVPAPPVRAVLTAESGLGEGYITDFIAGETIARRILREARFAGLRGNFAAQCGEILARIHAMDKPALPFLLPLDGARQIARYREVYDSCDCPVPALEVGLRWAEDHLPAAARNTVVHGDFRMGNLICGEQRIHAVLDWELACTSDPMQDLGWLCVKTWRFGGSEPVGGIGRREDLFAAYERATGIAVDPAHVYFWEGWGCVRWAIICLVKGLAHRSHGAQRTVEALAIGRRMEEPLLDFLELLKKDLLQNS